MTRKVRRQQPLRGGATVSCVELSLLGRRAHGRDQRAGFTLLEVSLVLALMIVVAALAIPAYRGTLKFERLRKAAESIRADWTRTRTRAMMTGETQVWACLLASGSFSASPYTTDDGQGATAEIQNLVASTTGLSPTQSSANGSSFGQTFPEDVTISEILVSDADSVMNMESTSSTGEEGVATLFFYSDGSSSSGRITLTNEDGQSIAVVINGLAGTVRVMQVVMQDEAAL